MINLKKIICIICSFVFIFSLFNLSVFATESKGAGTSSIILTGETIIEEAEGIYNTSANARATGLISQKTLTLSKTGTQLIISAKTKGSDEVDKCGFTYIKLQRLVNGSWTDYSTYCYSDLYSDSATYSFAKTILAIVLTIACLIIMFFITLMLLILFEQLYFFISTLIFEMRY